MPVNHPSLKSTHSWREALVVYLQPRVLTMLFLGLSAGIPLLLIFSSLSLWLREAGVERSDVTYFVWAALGYSFKFVWAPLIDKLPLPFLFKAFGRRRSWLLVAQAGVIGSIILMAMTDPKIDLVSMAIAAVLLGFSSASQDIVIDAYRIESAVEEIQAALSASYTAGYRIGMIMAGAGALYLSGWLGVDGEYSYEAWRTTYLIMASMMCIGVVTTLMIREPARNVRDSPYLHSHIDYLRFVLLFVLVTASFILTFFYSSDPITEFKIVIEKQTIFNGVFSGFLGETIRLSMAITVSYLVTRLLVFSRVVNYSMVEDTYIEPVVDFFKRYGKEAILILILVGFYRVSDIVLGAIANIFYQDTGFSKQQIGTMSIVFGIIMTIVGGFVGGILTMRYGILRILLLGAVLSSLTNLLFLILANVGANIVVFGFVIVADNLSGGLAIAAFIAYLSSLTNISFTAVQYAIFSSLMTLFPKLLGGYSGSVVDQVGYPIFFIGTTLLGVPVILLILFMMRREK